MKERLSKSSEMPMIEQVKKYKVDGLDQSYYLIRYDRLNIIKDGLYEFVTESSDHKYPGEKRKITCENQTVVEMNNYVYDRGKRKFLLRESRYVDGQFLVWEFYDKSGRITRRSKLLNNPEISLEKDYWGIRNNPMIEEHWEADGTYIIGKLERGKFIEIEKYNATGQLIGKKITIQSKKYGKCYCFENYHEDGSIDWTPVGSTLRKLGWTGWRDDEVSNKKYHIALKEFLKEVAREQKKQKEAIVRQSSKKALSATRSPRKNLCQALDTLNKLKPSQYRKEAKETLVKVYRSFYPKEESR